MSLLTALALLLTGAFAGLVGALLGVGGGVVIVPVLHLLFDLPLAVAVGTSLVVITGTSLIGTAGYVRRGLALVELALSLELFTLGGALVASRLAAGVPEPTLRLVFAVALLTAAVSLWWRGRTDGGSVQPAAGGRLVGALGATPLVGAAAGLLGIGGGLIQVPILRLLLGLEMRRAVATSTVTVGLTASLAALAYLDRGEVEFATAPWLLAGILAGAGVAPSLTDRLPRRWLELLFTGLLLYGAWRMVAR